MPQEGRFFTGTQLWQDMPKLKYLLWMEISFYTPLNISYTRQFQIIFKINFNIFHTFGVII